MPKMARKMAKSTDKKSNGLFLVFCFLIFYIYLLLKPNNLKTLLTFLLILTLSNLTIAQTTVILDTNFEQDLINLGYDSGTPDGFVLTANVDTLTILDVSYSFITDLTGIEDFAALTNLNCSNNNLNNINVVQLGSLINLNCSYNQLTSLDVTQNANLIYLRCDDNNITSLDVTQNTGLIYLDCYGNQLTNLDLTQNFALTNLNCFANQLTNLDVTQNILLIQLLCGYNQLTSLDISQNTDLTTLYCDSNQLSSLDVTQHTALEWLRCSANQLTSLNVTQNTDLIILDCHSNLLSSLYVTPNTALNILDCYSNQLTSLNLTQNIVLTDLDCHSNQLTCLNVKNGNNTFISWFDAKFNSNLTCIEVDNVAYSTANWLNIDLSTSFSTNCNTNCPMSVTVISPITICQGDSALIFGNFQDTPNIYYEVLTNVLGFDSIVSQELIVIPPYVVNQNSSICQGDSLLIYGNYQNTAGVYIDSLQTINGCDSVLLTTLSVNPIFTTNLTQSICQGDSLLIFGNYQNTAGIYIDSSQTINGCDSVITIILTINSSTFSVINPTTCNTYTSPSNNYTWSSSGIYQDTIANSVGCDSIITINLIIKDNSYSTMNQVECDSYLSPSGNATYTTSGTYLDTLTGVNINGCDSIITINLTINTVDVSVTNSFPTLSSNSLGSTYQWVDCDNMLLISGDTNQNFTSSVNGSFAVIVTKNGCQDTSVCEEILYEIIVTIPNTITPNGDGVNDFWIIDNIEKFPDHFIQVFNRNGSSVFQSTDYQNDWSGQYNGNDLPATTYYYVIDLGMGKGILKGDLSIIRE